MKVSADTPVQTIPKEEVLNLEFPSADVIEDPAERKQRYKDLERALSLGNLDHVKVRITFSDKEGLKQVETTVWGLTDKRVILKGGAVIPIHRVHKVI